MTKTKLNIESWNRKEHFRFFSAFDDPFFGITTNVDFTTIYLEAKHDSQSFFLYSLHHILTKANETDEFKLRIEGENSVVKYDTIHVSPTIGREDGTFGFAFFEYIPDRNDFIQQAIQEITRVKNSTGLSFSKNTGREDVIRYSSIPWFSFSEMKHAVSFKNGDSVPRISTGKLIDTNGKMKKHFYYRNLLAHRNGRKKDGGYINITNEELKSLITDTQSIAKQIQTKIKPEH